MSITVEQLQDRKAARNPAQWDWRLITQEEPRAGNCSVLNLRFERIVIAKTRSFARFNRAALVRKLRWKRRLAMQKT